jgi:SAM-dependent methyltransferase
MTKLAPHLKLAAVDPDVDSDDDLLADIADEVAALHGIDQADAQMRFRRFLAVYHDGSAAMTEDERVAIMTGDVEHSFIRLSKPYRFRHASVLPSMLSAVPRFLETSASTPSLLDFGGGGGTDAIVYARSGFDTHYADLLTLKATDVVARRFELRGLDIPIWDARQLPAVRFDVVSAIDVLEHLYDIEHVLASLLTRVEPGGLLCCVNAFAAIDYDGDHLEKNRVYLDVFPRLMAEAGFDRVFHRDPLEIYRLPLKSAPLDDEAALRRRLYEVTLHRAAEMCDVLLAGIAERIDWDAAPPGARAIPVVEEATAATAGLRHRVFATTRRYAPRSLIRVARRIRSRHATSAVRRPTTSFDTVSSLADWVAVLRIAKARLRR